MPRITINQPVQVEAAALKLHCKVCDRFTAMLLDTNGNILKDQDDGYVPGFMPGRHHGDYLILDIDINTGQITNWTVPSAEALQEWIKSEEG